MPYYSPKDEERAKELLYCLQFNLACPKISKIFLLVDDDTITPFQEDRLELLRLPNRPTYLDWVKYSQSICPDGISILANSDIYFDNSIAEIRQIFASTQKAFVALSRYDKSGADLRPHPDPHWSQDTWAFCPKDPIPPSMERQLQISLGVPRCDNKIAYVFSLNGFSVFNPFKQVKSVHVHESNLRYYDKKGDKTITGGMAMVHPSPDLTSPAPLDIEIWSQNSKQYTQVNINNSLENWAEERARKTAKNKRVFGHNDDWQYPAITEKYAYEMMSNLVPEESDDGDMVYFGFPWATLIDLKAHCQHDIVRIRALEEKLATLSGTLKGRKRVITVCQHIRMHQFVPLFQNAGITDIYWTHKEKEHTTLDDGGTIKLHPFPLYPVQQSPQPVDRIGTLRPILFSFVGAKANHRYLTTIRDKILELLKDHPRGKVIDREDWHFNKIVYDKQILGKVKSDVGLVDEEASKQFRQIMAESTFSLCPSGTGPNSIRLWEAVLNNSIPVVLADSYDHPGNKELWNMAVVQCAETEEALLELPDRLEKLAKDPVRLKRKQVALHLLAQKYGTDLFVHDILRQLGVLAKPLKPSQPSTV